MAAWVPEDILRTYATRFSRSLIEQHQCMVLFSNCSCTETALPALAAGTSASRGKNGSRLGRNKQWKAME
jgi:hypothetical protein